MNSFVVVAAAYAAAEETVVAAHYGARSSDLTLDATIAMSSLQKAAEKRALPSTVDVA